MTATKFCFLSFDFEFVGFRYHWRFISVFLVCEKRDLSLENLRVVSLHERFSINMYAYIISMPIGGSQRPDFVFPSTVSRC